MMKNRIFSRKLFFEFMRQLRLPGYIFSAILCVEAVLIFIGSLLNSYTIDAFGKKVYQLQSFDFLEIHPLSLFAIFVFAPILVFCALNWVNKRNSSDFYHAVCEKRECVFLSAFVAAIAWLMIELVSSSVVAVISHAVFPKLFLINYASVFVRLAVIVSGSLFVSACVAVAMSITGTAFNNIIVSGILIFLPSAIMFTLRVVVIDELPIMTSHGVLGHSYSIPFGMLEMIFNGYNIIDSIPAAIYTFIIALAYTVLAAYLFKIRKSEFAGNSAVGKRMQTIFRVLVGTVFSLIPCAIIFNMLNVNRAYEQPSLRDDIFILTVLYTIVVLAVLIYELIATKKFRNLLPALKSLGYVAIVNIALIGAMFGMYNGVLSFTPDADDIKSVQIYITDRADINSDYYNALTGEIKLDSKQIREIISEALKDNVRETKWDSMAYNGYYGYVEDYTVAINTTFGTRYRHIYFNESQYSSLINEIKKDTRYQDIFLKLPKYSDVSINTHGTGIELTEDEEKKLYEYCREDYLAAEFTDVFDDANIYSESQIGSIDITVPVKTSTYPITVYIDQKTPSAYNYLIGLISERNKDIIDDLVYEIEHFYDGTDAREGKTSADVCFFNMTDEKGNRFDNAVYNKDIDFKKLAEFIKNNADNTPQHGDPMISVMFYREAFDYEIINGETYEKYNPEASKEYFVYIKTEKGKLPDFYTNPYSNETEQAE